MIKPLIKPPPYETKCDCCEQPATLQMDVTSTVWCAEWFIGYYCENCFCLVEAEMNKGCEND